MNIGGNGSVLSNPQRCEKIHRLLPLPYSLLCHPFSITVDSAFWSVSPPLPLRHGFYQTFFPAISKLSQREGLWWEVGLRCANLVHVVLGPLGRVCRWNVKFELPAREVVRCCKWSFVGSCGLSSQDWSGDSKNWAREVSDRNKDAIRNGLHVMSPFGKESGCISPLSWSFEWDWMQRQGTKLVWWRKLQASIKCPGFNTVAAHHLKKKNLTRAMCGAEVWKASGVGRKGDECGWSSTQV